MSIKFNRDTAVLQPFRYDERTALTVQRRSVSYSDWQSGSGDHEETVAEDFTLTNIAFFASPTSPVGNYEAQCKIIIDGVEILGCRSEGDSTTQHSTSESVAIPNWIIKKDTKITWNYDENTADGVSGASLIGYLV